MTRSVCGLLLVAALILGGCTSAAPEPASHGVSNWSRQARAFARAVNVRMGDIRGASKQQPGRTASFAPAPLSCSREQPAEAGGTTLIATPYGYVASAVSVRTSTRVAVQQMRKLLSPFGRLCFGRSLGESGELLEPKLMSFEVTGDPVELPKALGAEALGKTVLAETTTASDLVKASVEAHRLGHPTPGAKVINVYGAVFRVGPAQVLLMAVDERGEPSQAELDRLLLVLHQRAIDATP
jgi:hypothetical protein